MTYDEWRESYYPGPLMNEAMARAAWDAATSAERNACVKSCKEQRLLIVEDEAKYASLGIAMCVDAIKTRGIK